MNNILGPATKFFFEFFSEEIPAKMQKTAEVAARTVISKILEDNAVKYEAVTASCATRRLCVCVEGIAEQADSTIEEKRGPRTSAPETAIAGFLRINCLKRGDLFKKDGYFYAKIEKTGELFVNHIPALFADFIRLMPWPKTMHWYNSKTKEHSLPWVRPVRSVMCFFCETPIVFDIDGWGITTGNITKGNRCFSDSDMSVSSYGQYKHLMSEAFVIANYTERQQIILSVIEKAVKKQGVLLKHDQALLDEVTGLVDYPFAIVGNIDENFMELPDFVLSTSMRVHQKYFSTVHENDKIAPFFVAISNRAETDGIRLGFERVLNARLSDALFFYNADLKIPLSSRTTQLESVIFHEKLGTVGQKVARLGAITTIAKQAALLCKMDLATLMVGEFAELQGLAGACYAQKQGEAPETVTAIREHYKPAGPDDSLPSSSHGLELSLCDKVDTLVGFLGIGIKPSGSKDPFALRRAALGVIRIALETNEFNLRETVLTAVREYYKQNILLKEDVFFDFTDFLLERFAFYLKDQLAVRYDIVESVISFQRKSSDPLDIYDAGCRVSALDGFLKEKSSDAFMTLFMRIEGIIKQSSVRPLSDVPWQLNEDLFEAQEEHNVCNALDAVYGAVLENVQNKDFLEAMRRISSLYESFENFFTAVKVNSDNLQVRENRYAILRKCLFLCENVSDFSKIRVK
ncbi:MAG: glycine--tRNA ligase subunit beta [Holosporales bacterium]|jgi:glycyl-tRNA synthetase beta chain|nr:glycine--tRNA ligase subunit beta [Holosporales bacterium]